MTVSTKKIEIAAELDSDSSDTAHESSVSGFETISKKKSKRYCVFRQEWLTEDGLLWLGKIDKSIANYTVCRQSFSVKYEGKSAVTTQAESTKHKNAVASQKQVRLFQFFCEEKYGRGE